MCNILLNTNPLLLAFIAGLFTFSVTSLGASIVFFFKSTNKNIMDTMLALSSGIMLSAAFFSLLSPAIEMINHTLLSIVLIIFGFIFGGLFLLLGNSFINQFNLNNKKSSKRFIMLFTAITLHNIPEGLVIGVAFGMALISNSISLLIQAITLTIAIAIQNFPEGCAISLPLRREGISRSKAFLVALASGVVEPISAIFGALLIIEVKTILPFILAFAAGAMIYVIVIDLIPESQTNKKQDHMALYTMIGFSIMMFLEIIL